MKKCISFICLSTISVFWYIFGSKIQLPELNNIKLVLHFCVDFHIKNLLMFFAIKPMLEKNDTTLINYIRVKVVMTEYFYFLIIYNLKVMLGLQ